MGVKPKLIAEVGTNHQGVMENALEMVRVLSTVCKVDVVKFQKRNPRESLSKTQYDAPHPNPHNAFGSTYGAHREFLEFSIEEHRRLKAYCEDFGVIYSSSAWDRTSARELVSLSPELIKVASASNQNFELLGYFCDKFEGKIHVSLGMTSRAEEDKLVEFFGARSRLQDLVLYACTSGYPVSFEDLALLEIDRLGSNYGTSIDGIGFSGHHLGIAADIAAMTLGASWVERHFTFDRTLKGTDHAASLEPDGMRRLARDLSNVSKALDFKRSEILDVELEQRDKLKWRQSKDDLSSI